MFSSMNTSQDFTSNVHESPDVPDSSDDPSDLVFVLFNRNSKKHEAKQHETGEMGFDPENHEDPFQRLNRCFLDGFLFSYVSSAGMVS